ncbi:MAG: YitT family protein [Clostridium fessum]
MLKLFHSLDLKLKSCLIALFGSAFLAFGLYHVHSFSGVTEGGVLGMTLLLEHWFHISPSVSGFIMNLACTRWDGNFWGGSSSPYSILSSASFSLSYRICEQFPPLWPQLADMPLAASLLGAVFVGVGAGLCVRIGGAPGGDDALAMSLSHVTHIKIQWIYLLSDFRLYWCFH